MLPINWKDLGIKLLIIIIPVIVLYLGVVAEEYYTSQQQTIDSLEVEKSEVELQLDITQSQLEATQEQLRLMTKRVTELERAYEDVHMVWRSIDSSRQLSRGDAPVATALPVDSHSYFSEHMFEKAFAGTGLEGIGGALVAAEADYKVNAVILAGIIVLETGWGSSQLAKNKNNLAGINACGSDVYANATRFNSKNDCVYHLAKLLSTHYSPGGKYFGGSYDIRGINKRYAEDPKWASKVSGCMKIIFNRAKE